MFVETLVLMVMVMAMSKVVLNVLVPLPRMLKRISMLEGRDTYPPFLLFLVMLGDVLMMERKEGTG